MALTEDLRTIILYDVGAIRAYEELSTLLWIDGRVAPGSFVNREI